MLQCQFISFNSFCYEILQTYFPNCINPIFTQNEISIAATDSYQFLYCTWKLLLNISLILPSMAIQNANGCCVGFGRNYTDSHTSKQTESIFIYKSCSYYFIFDIPNLVCSISGRR